MKNVKIQNIFTLFQIRKVFNNYPYEFLTKLIFDIHVISIFVCVNICDKQFKLIDENE
jgi:hypothetical protein